MLPEALSGPRDRPIRSSMMYLTVDPFLSVCVERRQYYVGTSAEDRPEIQGYRTITRHSPEGYIVPEYVWRDAFSLKGGIVPACGCQIFGKHSLHRVGAEAPTICVRKKHLGTAPAWFLEPCLYNVDRMLSQRCASLLSALAKTTNVRAPAQDN